MYYNEMIIRLQNLVLNLFNIYRPCYILNLLFCLSSKVEL